MHVYHATFEYVPRFRRHVPLILDHHRHALGDACVSTCHQSLDQQLDALTGGGIAAKRIYPDNSADGIDTSNATVRMVAGASA
jgi:hypothetical protein